MTQTYTTDPSFNWINPDFIDFMLRKINPLWSTTQIFARVHSVRPLGDQMTQLTLKPNKHFRGFKPGQFVTVRIQIAGRYEQRCYSIISFENGLLALGVKSQGLMSRYIETQLGKGEIIEISPAQGAFTLEDLDSPALFIASGSGITPIVALLSQSLQQNQQATTLLYFAREHVLTECLEQLKEQHSQLRVVLINTRQTGTHLSEELLLEHCTEFKLCQSYVCGASGLMKAAQSIWQTHGIEPQLKQEFFSIKLPAGQTKAPVMFKASQRSAEITGSLLAGAEAAGLSPKFGCRMGVCNTCVCTKIQGTTRNMLSGELNHQPGVPIRLCISEAVSPVELDI